MNRPGDLPDSSRGSRPTILSWVFASTWGWFLGFSLVIVLSIAWESVGGSAQFPIGVGMGAGVGLAQGAAMKRRLGRARPWAFATLAGTVLAFAGADLFATIAVPYSLPVAVLIAGLLAGVFQARLLRREYDRVGSWIAASVAAWGAPAGVIVLGDALEGAVGGVVVFVTMIFGGVLLGTIGGVSLVVMERSQT